MTSHHNETFVQFYDRDSGKVFQNLEFRECMFDNCAISLTKSPALRCTIRNVHLSDCVSVNCHSGPAIFDDVTVDGLKVNDLLILWGPLFRHVVLKGKIGRIKINKAAHFVDRSDDIQRPFDMARDAFYKDVDWAIDISQAEFKEFEMFGVPGKLVRRDANTQVIVTREKAIRPGWREELSDNCHDWIPVIDGLLARGDPDTILVAPKAKSKKVLEKLVAGLTELRKTGIAEPE